MEGCSVGNYHNSPCGLYSRYPRETSVVKLSLCQRDIQNHLKAVKLSVGGEWPGFCSNTTGLFVTEADLVCRRVGIFNTNPSLTVCPLHRYKLGVDFRQTKNRLHPDHTGKGKTFRGISVIQSQKFLEDRGVFLPVGSGICYQCHTTLSTSSKQESHEDIMNPSLTELFEEDNSYTYNFHDRLAVNKTLPQDNDKDSQPGLSQGSDLPSINSSQASNWSAEDSKDIPIDNINTALLLLSNGQISPVRSRIRMDINSLQPSSRRALKRKAVSAVEALLDSLAPGQGTELLQIINEGKCANDVSPDSDLQKTIIKLYNSSNDCLLKKQTLSMLAKDHTKKQLMEMIPNLSTYSIDQARLHAFMYGEGAQVPKPVKHFRQRMDQDKMAHALDFLFNPLFHQVSAYGTKEMKLDSGDKVEIPAVVRTVCHGNLIHMYEAFCKEAGFAPLSQSSLFQILNVCPASKRTSLKGLDNISADGAIAFDNIDAVISQMKPYITDPSMIDTIKKLKQDIQACKLYIKTDFKLHLALDDHCPDHCVKYALSDPTDPCLQAACSHNHDMTCDRCEIFTVSMTKLKKILSELQDKFPEELYEELLKDIDLSESHIQAWRQHVLRCFNQDRGPTSLLDKLKPGEV